MIAEFVVFVVQFRFLKDEVKDAFKRIHYGRILIAILLSSIGSLWIKHFLVGNFKVLVMSAVAYFGIYGIVLLLFREEMVVEIVDTVIKNVLRVFRKSRD